MGTDAFIEKNKEGVQELLKDHVVQEHGLAFYYEIIGKRMKLISGYIKENSKERDDIDNYISFKAAYNRGIEELPEEIQTFEKIVTEIAIDSF